MEVEIVVTDDSGRQFKGVAKLMAAAPMTTKRKKAAMVTRKEKNNNSLAAQILVLRNEGLFSEPRVAAEVHGALQGRYHCDVNRVEVALLRMQRRKELRKASKVVGAKQKVAYVW